MQTRERTSDELAALVTAELRKHPGFDSFGSVRVYGHPEKLVPDGINWSIAGFNKGACEIGPDEIKSALARIRARLGRHYRAAH